MKDSITRVLHVPADQQTRKKLRDLAGCYVRDHQLMPPPGFEVLSDAADRIIESAGSSPEFHSFTMVLLSNEIWKPVFMATPYHRRLLLLPQCLKNNQSCKGVFDEFGLICAGCNSCSLNHIVTDAERLGYSTLIAEGTTVAMGLVEEGSIDAVIGVSCMAVFERSYNKIDRSALPAIGIPLLCDGCSDTTIDPAWLMKELRSIKPDPALQPLSVSLLKEKIQAVFTKDLLEKYFSGEDDHPAKELAIRSMLNGGQRIRPILAAMAYKAYSSWTDDLTMETLAVVVECFHKASLIHDDIEDRDDYRYELETLHKQEGIPQAINTGDYLIGKGYELLSGLQISTDKKLACMSLASVAHVGLSTGQGFDLVARQNKKLLTTVELIKIYALKTGLAVEVALQLGAVAGGAPRADLDSLKKFSYHFGVAYQLRDDLEEFCNSLRIRDWHDFHFPMALLWEELDGVTSTSRFLELDDVGLKALAQKYGLEEKVAKLIHDHVNQAYTLLEKLSNLPLKLSLYAILGKIFGHHARN